MRPSEILGLLRHDIDLDSVWVRGRIFRATSIRRKQNGRQDVLRSLLELGIF